MSELPRVQRTEETITQDDYIRHTDFAQVRRMLTPEGAEVWITQALSDHAVGEGGAFDLREVVAQGLAILPPPPNPEDIEWSPWAWRPWSRPTEMRNVGDDVLVIRQPTDHPGKFITTFMLTDEF